MSRSLLHSDYVSGSNYGMKNRIINGKMDISQRGTSFAGWSSANGAGYATDRFRVTVGGTSAVVTATQQADAPSSSEFQNSLRVAVTTADTSIASTDVMVIDHNIEGYNIRDLIGRTFTVSFWVRSSKTGVHCLSLQNGASDRSYIVEYTIAIANTWEYKTITITGGLPTAGTWNYTNGTGLGLRFALAGGTTFQTTSAAWNTGNFTNTSNQVNCLDTIGNIFAITGVQLEVGAIATPFEHRPYGTELALCQRYCYVWSKASGYKTLGNGQWVGTTVFVVGVKFPVTMRTTPTPTYPTASTIFVGNSAGTALTCTSIVDSQPDNELYTVTINVASGGVAGNAGLAGSNNTASTMIFSAEL